MGVKADFNPELSINISILFRQNILSVNKDIFTDFRVSQTVALSCPEFKTFAAKLRGASEIIL